MITCIHREKDNVIIYTENGKMTLDVTQAEKIIDVLQITVDDIINHHYKKSLLPAVCYPLGNKL